MRVVKPLVVVEDDIDGTQMARKIEYFTRKCYQSEGKMTDTSYEEFVRRIFRTRKHEGIIEHRTVSVTFTTDRGVSHELVRHRIASYLQESTRYCDYAGNGAAFILPAWIVPGGEFWVEFINGCMFFDNQYRWAREGLDWTPQQARGWLPNFLKTEITATMNLRSWHNFLRLRTHSTAHPQMRQIAVPLLRHFQMYLPMIFDGIELPTLDFPEANLIVHPGVDPVELEVVYAN